MVYSEYANIFTIFKALHSDINYIINKNKLTGTLSVFYIKNIFTIEIKVNRNLQLIISIFTLKTKNYYENNY